MANLLLGIALLSHRSLKQKRMTHNFNVTKNALFIVAIFLLSNCTLCLGQNELAFKNAQKSFLKKQGKEFGQYKTYPKEYELECLVALSYYPELKNVRIDFKRKKIKSTMRAHPCNMLNLFRGKSKRNYCILITTNQDPGENVVVNDLSFNSKVGVLGHELAHIYQYYTTPLAKFVGYFFSNKIRKRIECEADKLTVEHGLGYSLYAMRYYSLHLSGRAEKRNLVSKKYYLSPEEILQKIEKQPSYSR